MLSVAEALNVVLQHAPKGGVEPVSLTAALNRSLAEDLFVTQDSPPFDKSLMDGFAVTARRPTDGYEEFMTRRRDAFIEDAVESVITLPVVETITAGRMPTATIHDGNASRIMTGAPLPPGCDCVVPIEQTQFDERNPGTVRVPLSAMRPEANLMRQGTAAKAGSRLLKPGMRLQPQHIAALAEFGIGIVPVHRTPAVAVLATGDELMTFDQPLQSGRIRNSNEPMLLAQVTACNATSVALGIARDNDEELLAKIQKGLQQDVLLLTGGVSAGLLDLVPKQLAKAGVQQIFHGVNMKPGKPLWFGKFAAKHRMCLVFGLPGNPVSSLACFELFVRPALNQLSGCSNTTPELSAVLTESITIKGNRPTYQPAAISVVDGRLTTTPVPWSGSSDLRATVEANGMALLTPDHGPYSAGQQVAVWLWGNGRLC